MGVGLGADDAAGIGFMNVHDFNAMRVYREAFVAFIMGES